MENIKKIFEDLNDETRLKAEETKKELLKLREENKKISKKLKKEVASICLRLINETPENSRGIEETSYVITGYFVPFSFEDKLDDAISIAGELELPEEHVSENSKKLWKKMKRIFLKYLEK